MSDWNWDADTSVMWAFAACFAGIAVFVWFAVVILVYCSLTGACGV